VAQQPIELILARQFADHLATPMIVVDAQGTAVFWNEPAEQYTGLRFDEMGRIPKEMWVKGLSATDERGAEVPTHLLPPVVALEEHRPAFMRCAVRLFDTGPSSVVLSALPIMGQQGRFLGLVILFWRADDWEAVGS
jgi:PAS domain-containing protein